MILKNHNTKKQHWLFRMRLFMAATVFAVFSLNMPGVANAADTVRVGHFSWPGYGFHYVAEAEKLTDLKFDNTIIEDPVQLFSLLSTNQLDVVFSTIEFGPIAAAEEMGFKLINLSNLAHGSDKIVVHPDIKEAADLKGKQVAILEGGLSHIMMGIWLQQNGVKYDEVQMVNLIAGDAAAAMISGQVAAAELWAPFNQQVLDDLAGSRTVADSFDPYWLQTALIADAIYMSSDFLENHRETAVKALQAIYAGVEFWRSNAEKSNKIIAEAVGFSVDDVSAILGNGKLTRDAANNDPKDGELYIYSLEDAARFCGVADGDPPFGQKNGQLKDHWELTNDWWINFGFITKRGDYTAGTDCNLVKEALAGS
ncbi:ABC transporter substrate-binding protein [Pseudomonadota bacterium]